MLANPEADRAGGAERSPPFASTTPRATARLQVHRDFTLDDALKVVPYLAALGISHVYTSPILTARAGSTHGYDIVDHSRINPELGGEAALRRLVAGLRSHGMGLIVDIVPNHMGVGGGDNEWWLDVLEWGRASPYAEFFDIDWSPSDPSLASRVLVPFLGQPYGEALEAGDITLRLDRETGGLAAVFAEHVCPITPRHYRLVFGDAVAPYTTAMAKATGRTRLRAAAAEMRSALVRQAQSDDGLNALNEAIARFDPSGPEGRARLHSLLERQHYRLVWWRAAADEINWRRFFDVTSLGGLRVELASVFDATHALILRLYGEGLIDGVRIDHIDGLADPRAYCRKLRRRMQSEGHRRPADAPAGEPFILVEKILAAHERLPLDWQTNGTTGYDFMDQVGGLLHDPDGEAPLTALWRELTGELESYETVERNARRLVLRDALASELNGSANAMHRVAKRDLKTRDYTATAIKRALTEILVHFPSYRLYAGMAGRAATDDRVLAWAMAGARNNMRVADHPLLELIDLWLGREAPRQFTSTAERRDRLRAMVKFEQLSSPVAAKSMEDTAFYRYGRLLSRNEVGSNPGQFALAPATFHNNCATRLRDYPSAMLATATHDHKRGEDLRVRLAVLSEIPEEWAEALRRWMRLNAPLRREFDAVIAPDAPDEIMLYEMLVGAWPPELTADDAEGVQAFAERIAQWQVKAGREAKRHTAWIGPDEAYEAACREFLFQVLNPIRPARLIDEIAGFAARIGLPGAVNSLAQTVLKLTVPGLPDLYQGTERWDFSLVDPDNRRPVDYAVRQDFLAEMPSDDGAVGIDDWRTGDIKQWVIARALGLRRRHPDLFAKGSYLPLRVEGPAEKHVLAFVREYQGARIVVAVMRLPARLLGASLVPDPARWQETSLVLPRGWAARHGTDVLTGRPVATKARLPAASLFGDLPVSLWAIG